MPEYAVAGDFACVLTVYTLVKADTPEQAIELVQDTLRTQAEQIEASLESYLSLGLGYPSWEPIAA